MRDNFQTVIYYWSPDSIY